MHRIRFITISIVFVLSVGLIVACSDAPPSATTVPSSPPPGAVTDNVLPQAQASYCANGGQYAAQANEQAAARVNGIAIPRAVFDRQTAQSQAALVQQGVDPNSAQGKEALKGLRDQVLTQLIDDMLIEQQAQKENVSPADDEINKRVQQLVNDAGGKAKFDEYLAKNQLTLQDLCQQIRANVFSEAMLTRVTQNLPTQVEQVHVAHILFAKKADADAARVKLDAGADFGALAKQVSQDEATRDNGGDLGWFARQVLPPEFDQAAFALKPGKISAVVSTQLGLHIIKVLERDTKRALSPEQIQNQRLAAFTAWLDALRAKAKIEKLIEE